MWVWLCPCYVTPQIVSNCNKIPLRHLMRFLTFRWEKSINSFQTFFLAFCWFYHLFPAIDISWAWIYTSIRLVHVEWPSFLEITILIDLPMFRYVENKLSLRSIFGIRILKWKHIQIVFLFLDGGHSRETFFIISPAPRFGSLFLCKFFEFLQIFSNLDSFAHFLNFLIDLLLLLFPLFFLNKFPNATFAFGG